MAKTWAEILQEHVDAAKASPEQQRRALELFLGRQGYESWKLWAVPDLGDGRVSEEDMRRCVEELRKLSDEELAKHGLRRMQDGFLVACDFIVNEVEK